MQNKTKVNGKFTQGYKPEAKFTKENQRLSQGKQDVNKVQQTSALKQNQELNKQYFDSNNSQKQKINEQQSNKLDAIKGQNTRHYHSLQRAILPWEQQISAQSNQHNSINQSIKNRDFSIKPQKQSNSRNHLYYKKSTMSRNSSTRSFADRSQKEILSPFYKPFEIFFTNRKKSPYLTKRSNQGNNSATSPHQNSVGNNENSAMQSLTTRKIVSPAAATQNFNSTFQPTCQQFNALSMMRSQTPSFQTTMINDLCGDMSINNKNFNMHQTIDNQIMMSAQQSQTQSFIQQRQGNVQNLEMTNSQKSIQSFFNQHIKKKIRVDSKIAKITKDFTKNRHSLNGRNQVQNKRFSEGSNKPKQQTAKVTKNLHASIQNFQMPSSRNHCEKIDEIITGQTGYSGITSNNSQVDRLKQEQAKFMIKNESDLMYSPDNEVILDTYIQHQQNSECYKVNRFKPTLDFPTQTTLDTLVENIDQNADHTQQLNHGQQQQIPSEYDVSLTQICEEQQNLKRYSDICPLNTQYKSSHKQCCHIEGQRHQMTRYALEKALKLAQVLMTEVSRLDGIVQNQKIQLQNQRTIKCKEKLEQDLNSDTEETGDEQDCQEQIEKIQASKIKKELLQEIINLNMVQNQDLNDPSVSKCLKKLYQDKPLHKPKRRRDKQNLENIQNSEKLVDSNKVLQINHSSNLNQQYMKGAANLMADVAKCVQQLDGTLNGRITKKHYRL
eukprot:403364078